MNEGMFRRLQDEIDSREKISGLTMSDVLDLPDALRDLIHWMIREKQVDVAQVTARLGNDERTARQMLDALLEKGYISEIEIEGRRRYRVRLASKRK